MCPWALGVATKEKLRIVVNESPFSIDKPSSLLSIQRRKKLISSIIDEARSLTNATTVFETALIVLPSLDDFMGFLRLTEEVEKALARNGLAADIQIATFHPKYRFEGTTEMDVENYTNRSPYPIVHLLRVDQVHRAIEAVNGDTDFVWKNNIQKLKEKGLSRVIHEFEQLFRK